MAFVVVENLLKYAKENLERALEGMGLSMIERQGETLRLIGKVHPIDKQTFVAVAKRETPATAVDAVTTARRTSVSRNPRALTATKSTHAASALPKFNPWRA